MRRILALVMLGALIVSTGCSMEDKRQWNEAVGDLRGDNTKTIAPISPKKSE